MGLRAGDGAVQRVWRFLLSYARQARGPHIWSGRPRIVSITALIDLDFEAKFFTRMASHYGSPYELHGNNKLVFKQECDIISYSSAQHCTPTWDSEVLIQITKQALRHYR